ncbi:hypothetical protein F5148DRAFT_885487 [Russula earlei]|uniref:Uncharacterized protein n=1 Tax=Russula earlei TaxID=71964 RepID=A0ACC0UBV2_9AGAM|nr:hypothetical protein F5148DRAFT_885487 [Russula earlei]
MRLTQAHNQPPQLHFRPLFSLARVSAHYANCPLCQRTTPPPPVKKKAMSSSRPPVPPLLGSSAVTANAMPDVTSSSPSSPLDSSSFFNGGMSQSLIVSFVSIGVFAFGVASLCAWRRRYSRDGSPSPRRYRPTPYRRRPLGGRRPQQHDDIADRRPAIFEAWTERRRTVDALRWEKSMPFSATLFTDVAVMRAERENEAIPDDGDGDRGGGTEKDKLHVREDTVGGLRVAVLVQMPSPTRAEAAHDEVGEGLCEHPVQNELAIGLLEVPWTREDHYSFKRTTS